MLPPESGGPLPPDQHPGDDITLDDFRRGLNVFVHVSRIKDPPDASSEERVTIHAEALGKSGFSNAELRHLLAWAIVKLANSNT